MHFPDTEISDVPALSGEIEFWLFSGKTIFKHHNSYWLRLFKEAGSRMMVKVSAEDLALVDPKLYTNNRGIIRAVRTYKDMK